MKMPTADRGPWIDSVAWIVGAILVFIAATSVWPGALLVTRVLGAVIFGRLISTPIAILIGAAWGNRWHR